MITCVSIADLPTQASGWAALWGVSLGGAASCLSGQAEVWVLSGNLKEKNLRCQKTEKPMEIIEFWVRYIGSVCC